MHCYVLFAHGARDPAWAEPLLRLREAVQRRCTQAEVRLAYLEFMSPDLSAAIDEAVCAGARSVAVVPVFLAQGGHVKRDLPRLVAQSQARHPQVAIALREALGESASVIDAMAAAVCEG